jgi:WD40 repeat protein
MILGAALGTFFVLVYLYSPDSLPTYKQRILAIFSSLLCGVFAFFLTGTIGLDSKTLRTPLGDVSLKATGGLALSVLVLLWWLSPFAPVTPDQVKDHPNGVRTPEPAEEKIALRPFAPWRVLGAVNSITLDSSGEGGAIAVETGAVHFWQTRPDGEPSKLPNTGEPIAVRSVSLGTNREMIATGSADGTVRLFRAGGSMPPEVVRSHSSQIFEVYLSHDGRRLVTTGEDSGKVKSARLWNIGTKVTLDRTLRTPNVDDDILAVSPDLQIVAIFSQQNRRIELWSIADGRFVTALKDSDSAVSGGGAFSEDTKLFTVGGADGAARLWQTADGERLKNFNGLGQRVVSVAIHPAGQMVAAGYADGTLYVWSVDDEKLEKHTKVHEQRVFSLHFSRNGHILGSGGEDGVVQLFEVTKKSPS